MHTPTLNRLWFTGILSLLCITPAISAEKETGPIVELPPFVVEESLTPPWRYASIPGVEIISRSPDRVTRQILTGHHRLHTLLGLMIPSQLQLQRETPLQYVIYVADNQSQGTREMVDSIEQQEKEALTANPQASGPASDDITIGIMPNFRFWDEDTLSVFFVVDLNSIDRDEITLSASYVRYLLEDRTPSLPRWYIEGMMELYPSAVFSEPPLETSSIPLASLSNTKQQTTRKGIFFKSLTWGSKQQTKQLKKNPRKAPEFIPLATLFSLMPSDLQAAEKQNQWKSQSALFIRWALDPLSNKGSSAERSRADALREFVSRSSMEPPTEALFTECFGLSTRDADLKLKAYLADALRQSFTLYPDKSLTPPVFSLRNASALEIGRIKGGLSRLEIRYVRAVYPALTGQYVAQARRVLRSAYDQGERDRDLLVELGLAECDARDDQAAIPFLREAIEAGVIRPRAYYELARIEYARLLEADLSPADKAKGYQEIFDLLATARGQAPSLSAVYELYARIWMDGEFAPTRERQAILGEGLSYHSHHQRLILTTALYYTIYGQNEPARSLINQGLRVTTAPNERAKFLKLKSMISEAEKQSSS